MHVAFYCVFGNIQYNPLNKLTKSELATAFLSQLFQTKINTKTFRRHSILHKISKALAMSSMFVSGVRTKIMSMQQFLIIWTQESRISSSGQNFAARQREITTVHFTKTKTMTWLNKCSLHYCLALKFGAQAEILDPCTVMLYWRAQMRGMLHNLLKWKFVDTTH